MSGRMTRVVLDGEALHRLSALQEADKAQAVWWNDVIDAFLVQPAAKETLGAKGRWWLAQTLFESARRFESAGRLEEARRAWGLIVASKLPGEAAAREQLARFHLPEAKS